MMAIGPSPRSTSPWNKGSFGMGGLGGGAGGSTTTIGIAILGEQILIRDIDITGGFDRLGRRQGTGGRRRHGLEPLLENSLLAGARIDPLAPQMDGDGRAQPQQRQVRDKQLALHSEAGPFFSGASLRGTTPDRASRTITVLSLGLLAATRISLVASNSGRLARLARKFTN